jgi:hypothetical protein
MALQAAGEPAQVELQVLGRIEQRRRPVDLARVLRVVRKRARERQGGLEQRITDGPGVRRRELVVQAL